MQNVQMKVTGNKLTITVDLTENLGLSASGKTVKIASTGGNKEIPGGKGAIIGLNIYRYPDAK